MIRSTGVFLQTAEFVAAYIYKYRQHLDNGILALRSETADLPILKDYKTAKSLLTRFKNAAPPFLKGQRAVLGKVWLEQLPGMCGTPWSIEEDDYAQSVIRTRTCLIPTPANFTFSGTETMALGTGIVNVVEHRTLHSEINLSTHPRLHLIVDVKRPEDDAEVPE